MVDEEFWDRAFLHALNAELQERPVGAVAVAKTVADEACRVRDAEHKARRDQAEREMIVEPQGAILKVIGRQGKPLTKEQLLAEARELVSEPAPPWHWERAIVVLLMENAMGAFVDGKGVVRFQEEIPF